MMGKGNGYEGLCLSLADQLLLKVPPCPRPSHHPGPGAAGTSCPQRVQGKMDPYGDESPAQLKANKHTTASPYLPCKLFKGCFFRESVIPSRDCSPKGWFLTHVLLHADAGSWEQLFLDRSGLLACQGKKTAKFSTGVLLQ